MDSDLAAHLGSSKPDFSARKQRVTEGDALALRPRARQDSDAPDGRARRGALAMRLIVVAAVWSLGLVIAALILPVYNGETISNSIGVSFTTETLVAGKGAWVLVPVAVPLVICGVVALALRRRRSGTGQRSSLVAWSAVGLLAAFGLYTILSIGAFIIPVALLLAGGIALTPAARAASARR